MIINRFILGLIVVLSVNVCQSVPNRYGKCSILLFYISICSFLGIHIFTTVTMIMQIEYCCWHKTIFPFIYLFKANTHMHKQTFVILLPIVNNRSFLWTLCWTRSDLTVFVFVIIINRWESYEVHGSYRLCIL